MAAAARTIVKDLAEANGVGRLYQTRMALEEALRDALSAVNRSSETGAALEEVHREALAYAVAAANSGITPGKTHFDLNDLDPMNPKIAADIDRRARAIENDKRTVEYRNRAANFLKHADRKKKEKGLAISDLDVFWVIGDAINLWMMLNLPLTDEMIVYGDWFFAVSPETPDQVRKTRAGPVHLLPFDLQIDAGRHVLESILAKKGRPADRFRHDLPDNATQVRTIKMFRALESE